jgi:hypothetical protein
MSEIKGEDMMLTETVKFKNKNGFIKRWGSSHPLVLEKIILYLNHNNFIGPVSWKDPSSLTFVKKNDEDFFTSVSICGVHEDPSGVFNFDISITISSKLVGDVEVFLDLWEIDQNSVENIYNFPYADLIMVRLSHLKWNVEKGENPSWQVVNAPLSIELAFEAWRQDWERFGVPFVNRIENKRDIVNTFFCLKDYKKNPWVKSDGPQTFLFFERGIILLALNGQLDDAKSLWITWSLNVDELKKSMRPLTYDFEKRRVLKLQQWLSEKTKSS